ncbi:MAG: YbjN domain-containing protein [Gemmobacter sp.]|uniref:YbjN domain-containing protein n=1 Tax=Gemmobacter sp. TaxID=1898957 RepID=UPI001A4B87DB|nr:YbjN domain-containing protein [Gemmobacter sp.]MBL8560881.1 YbjN domain-containing protein [Gemmobacter sp.]
MPPAQMVRAEAPEAMVALMQELGYRAELTTDGQGDPKIKSAAGGANFSVYFYGCSDHRGCRSVQFSAGFDTKDGSDLALMNDWNRHNRYGQASLDTENDPYIEMDIAMQGGLPRELFEANLSIWDNMLADFQRHIGW